MSWIVEFLEGLIEAAVIEMQPPSIRGPYSNAHSLWIK